MSADMRQWPAHLAVCDPWANIACLAHDYPERFVAKMEKWAQDKKAIAFEEAWIQPNSPHWISAVLDGPKPVNEF